MRLNRYDKKSQYITRQIVCCGIGMCGLAIVNAQNANINKKEGVIDTDTIVVTASGFAQQIKDAPASISVVSASELKKKPFRDVTDALRDIEGVSITGGGTYKDINIRGMGAQYTLILVNGKRQKSREVGPNGDTVGIEQGWIPPLSAIERIEVVRGPMSSLYGSDAMGGVINIITKKVADKWGGSVRLESTIQEESVAGNSNTADVYLNGPLVADILGLQLFAKYSGRAEDRYLGGFEEQKLNSVNAKLTFTPTADHTLELETGVSLQKRLSTVGASVASRPGTQKFRRENQSARYQGVLGKTHAEFTLSHEKTNNYVRKMIVNNINASGSILIPVATHLITVGGQYGSETLDDKNNQYEASISKLSRWSYALFVEDEWRVIDQFALTAGLRYDHDQNYGKSFNPRVYGVWNINDAFTLKGGVSTGFSAPGLRSVTSDWGQQTGGGRSNGIILGNPDLKPESTLNYEISLNYANDAGLTSSITGFYTKFKNKIQFVDICNDRTRKNKCKAPNGKYFDFIQTRTNVDRALLQGIEVSTKVPLPNDVSITSSYTWTKTEQTSGPNKGKVLNSIPGHQFNLGVDWSANDKVNLWAKARYTGEEKTISRSSEVTKTKGFAIIDIGSTYKVNKDSTLYAGIYNATNKQSVNSYNEPKDDGRRYWLGLNVDL